MIMSTFFYNINQRESDYASSPDKPKESAVFVPTQRVDDEEMSSTKTPEQASAIIEKRMAKAIAEEFSRLKLEA